jgi:hypothetical protein
MSRHIVMQEDDTLGLSGETRLVVALLRQTLTDLSSPRYGDEARQFFEDPAQVRFWVGLIGLDPAQVERYTKAALERPGL